MKKSLLVIIAIIAAIAIWAVSGYNGLVQAEENLNLSWNQVETQYQRRLDLIPNLVNTVKGAADFEQTTLTDVTEARTKFLGASTRGEQLEAAEEFEGALSRLLVTVEAYPQLQATQAFRDLMAQIEGTENRIAVARRDYNQEVRNYNVRIRRFPTSILAGMYGFEQAEDFDADEGAEDAPAVDFE